MCLCRPPGDLLYLDVVTLEGVELFVTACPSGFFLNRSTARDVFDPAPKKTSHHSTHLAGLLSVVSGAYQSVLFICRTLAWGRGKDVCLG